ncbi:hypothetical protein [Sinosporangium album]|nr:hypothetical protein [Sinosporangium album]
MSEPHIDPAGNTQAFRAFAQRNNEQEAAPPKKSYALPAVGISVGVLVLALVVYLLLS